MPSKTRQSIRLRGVRQNNLKGFDLDIPIGKLTVVTGMSGAGKSSLVFETLHAEGQRRYVETFSPYTRQFLDLLDRPKVDEVANIRPSIAIQQSNTVKTSRSTVGTITELCDYFKVWFANRATLFDPATGKPITDDNPQSAWRWLLAEQAEADRVIAFPVSKPPTMKWSEIVAALKAQGFTRVGVNGGIERIEHSNLASLPDEAALHVIQDRIKVEPEHRSRFIEAARHAFSFGQGQMLVLDTEGAVRARFVHGLKSPETGRDFRPAIPALFSFNSPIGACPRCRGFGRIIEIDDRLVVPDERLSIDEGAIRAFQGDVYSESLRDLQRAARRHGVPTDVPFQELDEAERSFVFEGEPDYEDDGDGWYGVRRFFDYLESKVYRMHVRVFLSKFRSYTECPDCHGARLQPEALLWKWNGHTLPDLYRKSVDALLQLLSTPSPTGHAATQPANDPALDGILTRLGFLQQVGLGYLTLDRTSRTLSGGETMRVNLTSCLGSALVDTLFVLDEPSVGLHARDLDRLVGILRRLTALGNTVVVVEHDESVMAAADHLVEIGPQPGAGGGQLVFSGSFKRILKSDTATGRFLSGRDTIDPPSQRRSVRGGPMLSIYGATKHNLQDLDLHLPQRALVCLSGVSGSGKSTLLDNVIHQTLRSHQGRVAEDPAAVRDVQSSLPLSEVVLVDQSPVSKTPRSNPALFSEAWDEIRKRFAKLETARASSMTAGHFSFNSGDGRCPACSGLGYEKVEMQFVSDLFVPCELCDGRRFKPEVLEIEYNGKSIADILDLDVDAAVLFFGDDKKIAQRLRPLVDVGLGYLTLGQPLNTLSGGEAQRLKLVRYLGKVPVAGKRRNHAATNNGQQPTHHSIILVDEPTTGLHRADIRRLITVFQSLVDAGHSLVVIEHNLDVLKVADWIVELGPEAGAGGGHLVAEGSPEQIANAACETAPYLREALNPGTAAPAPKTGAAPRPLAAAETAAPYRPTSRTPTRPSLSVRGAREHNLRNISVEIPHKKITVVTGVSGSGKSSLAFDIIFAEGQRRFMESMSAYARQFVEQMPRAEVDALSGIAPTVAIEQRVTKGTRKSTVATITEVAQYLRLLFARIGVQHSPSTGEPVVSQTEAALWQRLKTLLKQPSTNHRRKPTPRYLCAQLVRGRKGHHQPLADWARDHGYTLLQIDGKCIPIEHFKKLDRYREHDIDLVVATFDAERPGPLGPSQREKLATALKLGRGTAFLLEPSSGTRSWLSTRRTDPNTGEAFPELDPKHFSWNSPRGWCPTCRGYGHLYDWMAEEEAPPDLPAIFEHGDPCPDCCGDRLNPLSRAVRLPLKSAAEVPATAPKTEVTRANGPRQNSLSSGGGGTPRERGRGGSVSLPELLALSPNQLLETLRAVATDARSGPVLEELLPEIEERLRFMDRVGLDYLSLDRPTATLSGGEAQRIRLAAQLGSNLSGALYVLDEPSIGLHARDNARLIQSLEQLRERGNTLLVVEHDEATMRHANRIIDLGPAAGIHGGQIVAQGTLPQLKRNKHSLTGRYLRKAMPHPLRGDYRALPRPWSPRKKKGMEAWLALRGAALRNLKGFDLALPKQRLTAVCGVSGAGKSTLIRDLLHPLVETALETKRDTLAPVDSPAPLGADVFHRLSGTADIRKVIEVDQSPIGKTPRSTPATYIGAFDLIRDSYANLPEARFRGFGAGTFSFNTKGGRCESCKGAGRVKLEMNFMPDTYVRCEDCDGRRFGGELDAIQWKGKSIADVLAMSFEEAAAFFDFHSQLKHLLGLMVETGLGYLKLGQNSPTLSGGEAQRLKLVSELARGMPSFKERQHGLGKGNLYILEEPTIGLHLADVERLIELLHRLVDQGHTVIVIEHQLDVIRDADYVVEIGPDGGDGGGHCLYQGPVGGLRDCPESITRAYL